MPGGAPRSWRTEAVVLRHRPIGDADKICVLLTPGRGRVEAVARGVRKPKSKLAGHVAEITRGQFQLARGRTLHVVTGAQTLDGWTPLHEDVDRLGRAAAMCELADRSTEYDVPGAAVYGLLCEGLSALAELPRPDAAVQWFTLRYLDAQGYRPELDRCAACGDKLEPEGNGFSPAEGGAVCPACRRAGVGAPLSSTAFRLLRFMRRSGVGALADVRVADPVSAEIDRHLQGAVEGVLDGRLRSAAFVRAAERARGTG